MRIGTGVGVATPVGQIVAGHAERRRLRFAIAIDVRLLRLLGYDALREQIRILDRRRRGAAVVLVPDAVKGLRRKPLRGQILQLMELAGAEQQHVALPARMEGDFGTGRDGLHAGRGHRGIEQRLRLVAITERETPVRRIGIVDIDAPQRASRVPGVEPVDDAVAVEINRRDIGHAVGTRQRNRQLAHRADIAKVGHGCGDRLVRRVGQHAGRQEGA